MALIYQVLGTPRRDNALLVRIESGQSITRLLFDCGDACLTDISFGEIQAIDHLFFSHLHMDHISGFDAFFRCTYNRDVKPNQIWGPKGTAAILQHRFQGYWWNLVQGQHATWHVNDVSQCQIERYRYELSEKFAVQHVDDIIATSDTIHDGKDFTVCALHLSHHGPCLGYLIEEKPKINIDKERLASLQLQPGPWMQALKNDTIKGEISIGGRPFYLADLRAELLVKSDGDSLAYLTDFLLDEQTFTYLAQVLRGCQTVVCEAQYLDRDSELAKRNHHTTTKQVAQLAAEAEIGQLTLFHLSDRYSESEWEEMLAEASALFNRCNFPTDWRDYIEPRAECSSREKFDNVLDKVAQANLEPLPEDRLPSTH